MVDDHHSGRNNRGLAVELRRAFGGQVQSDAPMSEISQWRIGGPADVLFRPRNIEVLSGALRWMTARAIPVTVIGMTSNLLFSDKGVRGVVVQLADGLGGIDAEGAEVVVGAGVWVPYVALFAMRQRLAGIEHICGIPGSFGGLVSMNGGSLRKSISDNIVSVGVVSRDGLFRDVPAGEAGFGYRTSCFQESEDVIVSSRLKLNEEPDSTAIRRRMIGILRARRRFPRKEPNCGSVFVSDPALYEGFGAPGKVIEDLGLKGFRVGDAMVSLAHANFIINAGSATAEDVLRLIQLIRERVYGVTGHRMRVEARYVHPDGRFSPATGLSVLESTIA